MQNTKFIQVPIPNWVKPISTQGLQPIQSNNGVCVILSDIQILHHIDFTEYFYRMIRCATSVSGLEDIGHVSLDFDPMSETLQLIHVKVWSKGELKWQATLEDFDLIRRENGIERRSLNGRYSATLFIPNLEIGDEVETSYVLKNESKITKGLIEDLFRANWSMPCTYSYYRVIIDKNQAVNLVLKNSMPEPQILENGKNKEYIFEIHNSEVMNYEPDMPYGYEIVPHALIISDLQWIDLNNLFRQLYERDDTEIAAINNIVAQIQELQLQDEKQIAIAALKLVQGNFRYFAISIGEGGFNPRSLHDVVNTKYGDCKDKSLLLVMVLRKLGIHAAPALVNTNMGDYIDDCPPRPFVFNHCIVRVEIKGEIKYFDPTFSKQCGNWENIFSPDYGKALVLYKGHGLETMPPVKSEIVANVREYWTIPKDNNGVAVLKIVNVQKSWFAASLIANYYQDGKEKLEKDFTEYMGRKFIGIRRKSPLLISVDEENNEISFQEEYEIPNPFYVNQNNETIEFRWQPEISLPDFLAQEVENRKYPISLGLPRQKTLRATFEFAREINATAKETKVKSINWNMLIRVLVPSNNSVEIVQNFTCVGGEVSAQEAKKFYDDNKLVLDNGFYGYIFPLKEQKPLNKYLKLIFYILWFGFLIFINFIVRRN